MLQTKAITFGKLSGAVYDFPEAGDVLPMHQHGEADVHITVVTRVSFKAHGNGWERILKAGDVADWKPNDPQEFVALEADSRLVNIIKG